MNNISLITISLHTIFITLISSTFFMMLLSSKDELEQQSINTALKKSTIITLISIITYSFFMLSTGIINININIILGIIDELCILTLIFYYLELKGINLSLKIKNQKIVNILLNISITISVLSTISLFLKPKCFSNSTGFIRYDELILFINMILLGFIISMVPDIRKKLDRENFKKREKKLDKIFKIIFLVYCIAIVLFIAYVIYRKYIITTT